MHPLFSLALSHPGLLARHVAAYSALLAAETEELAVQLRQRMVVSACMLFMFTVALTLGGVGLMLRPLYLSLDNATVWVLWMAPLLPALGAVACALWLKSARRAPAYESLRGQLAQDAELFDEPELAEAQP
jgi:uncharacterized membrane protein YqjE